MASWILQKFEIPMVGVIMTIAIIKAPLLMGWVLMNLRTLEVLQMQQALHTWMGRTPDAVHHRVLATDRLTMMAAVVYHGLGIDPNCTCETRLC